MHEQMCKFPLRRCLNVFRSVFLLQIEFRVFLSSQQIVVSKIFVFAAEHNDNANFDSIFISIRINISVKKGAALQRLPVSIFFSANSSP